MIAAEALTTLLMTDPDVMSMIGGRVFPILVPQDAANPAIAFQQISLIPTYSHDGFSNLSQTRWQVTVQGDNYSQATRVAIAVRRRLRAFRGMINGMTVKTRIDNESDGYSDIGGQSGIGGTPVLRIDVHMWHDEQ